ncbi:MAG: preprotein translocase subunit YajC [Gammaproteobacteria bacterium]
MIPFISTAHAADIPATPAQGSGFVEIGILVFFFGIFYLMIWRPQAKRAKEHRNLISALAKGDEVVVAGGMLGRIADMDEQYITLKVSEGTNIRFQRQAVTQVLPKGTLKGL